MTSRPRKATKRKATKAQPPDSRVSAVGIAVLLRRLGATPQQNLAWVLDLTEKDLDMLRPEERVALGYDLRMVATFSLPRRSGPASDLRPMSDAALARYQQQIKDGIHGLLVTRTPWAFAARPILTPEPTTRGRIACRLAFRGDEEAGIMAGVAHLIVAVGDHLRVCQECQRPFVATKRQAYCRSVCSQRTRNRTRDAKTKKKGA